MAGHVVCQWAVWPWRSAAVKASAWLCSILDMTSRASYFTIDWSSQLICGCRLNQVIYFNTVMFLYQISELAVQRWNTIGWARDETWCFIYDSIQRDSKSPLPFIPPCFYHFPILHSPLSFSMCAVALQPSARCTVDSGVISSVESPVASVCPWK